jgi:hypothetical protein
LKTINLKNNSWHYFLAVTMGNFRAGSGDFCSYVRNVIFGFVLTVMLSAVAGFFGSALLAGLANIVLLAYHFFAGTAYVAPAFLAFGTVLLTAISIVAALVVAFIFIKDKLDDRALANEGKPDSFVKSAYQSFKDKVCFKVTFNGDK